MGRPAACGQRGGVATLVVLFLPCLLAGAALVIDGGVLLVSRAQVAAAADMGALAGVQDLDFERLAEGTVYILPGQAIADAEAWVAANLEGLAFIERDSLVLTVTVCNPETGEGGGGLRCPVTGRALSSPTVCVVVRAAVRLPFLPRAVPVTVRVHADASVVGRP